MAVKEFWKFDLVDKRLKINNWKWKWFKYFLKSTKMNSNYLKDEDKEVPIHININVWKRL